MRLHFFMALLSGLFFLISSSLNAGYIRGIELSNWCNSKDISDQSACVAYMLAVHDTFDAISAANKQRFYCMPNETGSKELHANVVSFLNENPKFQHVSASSIVLMALKKQYPCP